VRIGTTGGQAAFVNNNMFVIAVPRGRHYSTIPSGLAPRSDVSSYRKTTITTTIATLQQQQQQQP